MESKEKELHRIDEGESLFSAAHLITILKRQDALESKKAHRMVRIFVDDHEQEKFEKHLSERHTGLRYLPLPPVLLQLIFEYFPLIFFIPKPLFFQEKQEAMRMASALTEEVLPGSLWAELHTATAGDASSFSQWKFYLYKNIGKTSSENYFHVENNRRLSDLRKAVQDLSPGKTTFENDCPLELLTHKIPEKSKLYTFNFILFMASNPVFHSETDDDKLSHGGLMVRKPIEDCQPLTYDQFVSSCSQIQNKTPELAKQTAKDLQFLINVVQHVPRLDEVRYNFQLTPQDTGIAQLLYQSLNDLGKKAEILRENFPLLQTAGDSIKRHPDGSYELSLNRSEFFNITRRAKLLQIVDDYKPIPKLKILWWNEPGLDERAQKELQKRILTSSFVNREQIEHFQSNEMFNMLDNHAENWKLYDNKPYQALENKLKRELEELITALKLYRCPVVDFDLEAGEEQSIEKAKTLGIS